MDNIPMVLLTLFFALYRVIAQIRLGSDLKIIGGKSADIKRFPYQVSLAANGVHQCGGSLVDTDLVLTAAHCCCLLHLTEIRVGSNYADRGGEVHFIKELIKHPHHRKCNSSFLAYDICGVRLKEDVTLNENVQVIPLVEEGDKSIKPKTRAIVSGWGDVDLNGTRPRQLQATEVEIMSKEMCNKAYFPYVSDSMMCAGWIRGGRDACFKDSGGPLVVNGKLFGTVSWGVSCAFPNYPGVYTNISALRSFVDHLLNQAK